jgi:hypothetical protein
VTGAALLIIGVVALFAAIVGGGIKIQQIEVGSVQSKWRQWLLAIFGLIVGFIGLMLLIDDSDENSANVASPSENVAPVDENAAVDPNAVDENAVDENAADSNAEDANAMEGEAAASE